jgi:cell wall-associated NlpC family hydrolase
MRENGRVMAGKPGNSWIGSLRPRAFISLICAVFAVAIAGCGQSEDSNHVTIAEAGKAQEVSNKVPTDKIHHVYVKGAAYLEGARNVATVIKQKLPAAPKPSAAQLKPGPNGLPPASVGSNGSYKPRHITQRIGAHSMAGINGLPPERSAILIGRTALAPPSAPEAVNRAIGAANAIVGTPYIWGGGHGSWNSRGYDCSGSVSYALGGAGLLDAPLTSGSLESWGEPGPGKWITVYANSGHTYAVIAGLRWDTVGDAHGSGPRWHDEVPYPQGFTVRHPPGL